MHESAKEKFKLIHPVHTRFFFFVFLLFVFLFFGQRKKKISFSLVFLYYLYTYIHTYSIAYMYTYINIYINDSVRFCDTHAPPPLKFFRVGRWWPSKKAQKESIGLQEGKGGKKRKKEKKKTWFCLQAVSGVGRNGEILLLTLGMIKKVRDTNRIGLHQTSG